MINNTILRKVTQIGAALPLLLGIWVDHAQALTIVGKPHQL